MMQQAMSPHSPRSLPAPGRCPSPQLRVEGSGVCNSSAAGDDDPACFRGGVRQAGWLWKRFGHGHATAWKRLWFYMSEDRLCYVDAEANTGIGSWLAAATPGSPSAAAAKGPVSGAAALNPSTPSFLRGSNGGAGRAAGDAVHYIPLDRIPVRPLPHKQHALGPFERSHPDIGVSIVDSRVLTSQQPEATGRAIFSIAAGSHTHYLAADTLGEAQQWVAAIREAWLHCFAHTARRTGGVDGASGGAMFEGQRLVAENALLRESLRGMAARQSAEEGEYWRKWVEERTRAELLQSKLDTLVRYEVQVQTGDDKGAGTSARVYIQAWGRGDAFQGDDGLFLGGESAAGGRSPGTGEFRLLDVDSPVAPFARGAVDDFEVLCHDVGIPGRVRVWHDNTGRHPDWLLVRLSMRKNGAKDWTHFPCSRWLSTEQDDGRICRELLPGITAAAGQHVVYRITVVTSDTRGAGTDANVYIKLHGSEADGAQHRLGGGTHEFDRAAVDSFNVTESAGLGDTIEAITIGHDGSGSSPAWHLDRVEMTRLPDGPTAVFPCNAWLDARQGDGSTQRRLTAADGGSVDSANKGKAWYNLHITTSDVRDAGTDADVHVVLTGSAGGSGLVALPSGPLAVTRGRRDTFRLHLARLGDLQRITVGHNNLGASPSWHLESLEMQEEASGRTWHCRVGRWLGAAVGDGLSEVTLGVVEGKLAPARERFTVTFHTSSIRGAATTAAVRFQLSDAAGVTTGPVRVPAGDSAFQRGGTDSFSFDLMRLGQLAKLAVWHDGCDEGSAWHLHHVEVLREGGAGQPIAFPCSKWLAPPAPRVELTPGPIPSQLYPPRHYRLEFKTADVRGAGTDAGVTVELMGPGPGMQRSPQPASSSAAAGGKPAFDSLITTSAHKTDRPEAFERGGCDSFELLDMDVGRPMALRVASDGRGPRGAWRLEGVTVHLLDGPGGHPLDSVYFPANRWLDAESGLVAHLVPAEGSPSRPLVDYTLQVVTGSVKGAGTDANIDVDLIGRDGRSGWQRLLANYNTFERGQEDAFTLHLPDVGPLLQLAVRSDNAGTSPVWFLTTVCVTATPGTSKSPNKQQQQQQSPPASGTWWFVANRWLDETRGLEVVLDAGDRAPQGAAALEYIITVHTSDVRGAGTDASVFVEIFGDGGKSSGPLPLDPGPSRPDAFTRGASDAFTKALPPLGDLQRLSVWTDGRGSAWHMDYISVEQNGSQGTEGSKGAVWYFPLAGWLSGGVHPSSVDIEASRQHPKVGLRTYKVVVRTSDLRNAGTDADAFIQTSSPPADPSGHPVTSGRRPLRSSQPGAFGRGAVDRFDLVCCDLRLGERSECVVGLEEGRGEGGAPSWHLEQVEVTDPDTGVTWFFDGNCWLGHDPRGVAVGMMRRLKASRTDPRSLRALVNYKVMVHTSNRPGAGHEPLGLPVSVQLFGDKGSTGREALGRQPDALTGATPLPGAAAVRFQQAGHDVFELAAVQDCGELRRLRIAVDSMVIHPNSGRSWLFPCKAWLGAGKGSKQTERDLLVLTPDEGTSKAALPADEDEPWVISVTTSDLPGAEAATLDAGLARPSVFVRLLGSGGQAGPFELGEAACSDASDIMGASTAAGRHQFASGGVGSSRRRLFERGGISDFVVDVPTGCLGLGLRRLEVWLEAPSALLSGDTPMDMSWHLEVIRATRPDGSSWWFWCGAWLGGAAGDRRVMDAAASNPRGRMVDYRLTTFTGNRPGAGTDAHVFVDIEGASGAISGPLQLRCATHSSGASSGCDTASSGHEGCAAGGGGSDVGGGSAVGGPFAAGAASSFELRLLDLQEPVKLTVWHDGQGTSPGWHLDRIELQHKGSGPVWCFACGRWLDATQEDGAIRRTLVASSTCPEPAKPQPATPPEPEQTQPPKADSPTPDAEEAAPEVAALCDYKVEVQTGSALNAGTDARVFVQLTGELGETPACQLTAELLAARQHRSHQQRRKQQHGKERGPVGRRGAAGVGRGDSGGGAGVKVFHQGALDVFLLRGLQDVGRMTQLRVGHDASGRRNAWQLSWVRVTNLGTSHQAFFRSPAGDLWLEDADAAEAQGHAGGAHTWVLLQEAAEVDSPQQQDTKTALPPWRSDSESSMTPAHRGRVSGSSPESPPSAAAAAAVVSHAKQLALAVRASPPGYKITFWTSSMWGAGTAARIFFELIGELGSSGIVYVNRSSSTVSGGESSGGFDRGGVASLLFPRLPHLGALLQLRVGTDGGSMFAPWHLRRAEVVHVPSGSRWLFDCHAWIDGRCDFQRIFAAVVAPVGEQGQGAAGRGGRLAGACGVCCSGG